MCVKDSDSCLQVVVQKYVQNRIPAEKAEQVFDTLEAGLEKEDRFITVYVDVDLAYKITNSLNYEAARFAMMQMLEELIGTQFSYWKLENEEGTYIFIIRARENKAVGELKEVLETVKERAHPVVADISKPYKCIGGIKRSYEEAQKLFELASMAGASAFTIPADMEKKVEETDRADTEILIVNAVRRNDERELKEAFVYFIYGLPPEEEQQCRLMHKVMLKTELMIEDSYGMTEEIREQFKNYYANI